MRSADTPENGARTLTGAAFAAGSLDNITAVVVALRGYKAGAGAANPAVSWSPREDGEGRSKSGWMLGATLQPSLAACGARAAAKAHA